MEIKSYKSISGDRVMRSSFCISVLAGAFLVYPLAALPQEAAVSEEETTVEDITTPAESPVPGEAVVAPDLTIHVPTAQVRSPAQMDADKQRAPVQVQPLVPFRPTMDRQEYLNTKNKAAPSQNRPHIRGALGAPLAPPTLISSIEGVNQSSAGGLFPPDTHGATGPSHFVEITNSHLDVYNKSTTGVLGTLAKSVSLASFFGYFTQTLFDPRAVYDRTWNRWVITAEAFPESSTVQRHFIAISTTSSPLGSFRIYNINITPAIGTNNFWDFPQLGMDQDAVIITANVFSPTVFLGPRIFAVAKALLYNGLGFSVPVFNPGATIGTLAPPIVLDQNARTFLVSARPSGNSLQLFTLRDSSRSGVSLTGPVNVAVTAYTLPPPAVQCGGAGGTNRLNTSDARFVTASTQAGNFLWQAHSIDFRGAAVRWYKINTSMNAIAQSATHYQSRISSDFNVSIAANTAGDYYLTWSSTSSTVCPQVIYSGERSGVLPPTAGNVLFTSPAALTGNLDPDSGLQRWGDYSAVTLNPSNVLIACLVNEKVNSASVWGSRLACIRF